MRILGIDASTKTAISVVEGDKTLHTEQIFTNKEDTDFVRGIASYDFIKAKLEEYNPDMVVIEGYSLNSKFNLATMVIIGNSIRMALYQGGFCWYDAPPKSLKLWTTGKGTATKADMKAHVLRRFGIKAKNDDIADAIALGHYGQAMFVTETAKHERQFVYNFILGKHKVLFDKTS